MVLKTIVMKILLLILAFVSSMGHGQHSYEHPLAKLKIWKVYYEKNEFNEKTEKATAVGVESYALDTYDNELGVEVFFLIVSQQSVVIHVSTMSSAVLPSSPKVAIRTRTGVIRFRGERRGKFSVALTGNDRKKFINVFKTFRKVKMSVEREDGYYVADVSCRGFTKAWQKTGW